MDRTITTLSFELFPGRTLTLMPYHKVTNTKNVFNSLKIGQLPDTGFLNPAYIISMQQVLVAANKTLYYQSVNCMVTRELTTELLHTMSAQRNIGTSLREFGIQDDRPQFVAFLFDATEAQINKVRELVKGEAIPFESAEVSSLRSEQTIIKHYKIEKAELDLGQLEVSVINRIAARDL